MALIGAFAPGALHLSRAAQFRLVLIAVGLVVVGGVIAAVALWKARKVSTDRDTEGQSAMARVRGHTGLAEFRRNKGEMLDTKSAGRLIFEDNVGDDPAPEIE